MEAHQLDMIRRAVAHYEAGNQLLRDLLRAETSPQVTIVKSWPEAVPTTFIVRPGQRPAATMRARQIIDQLAGDLSGLNMLDYGCGEGWTAAVAADQAATVVGYDPTPSPVWETLIRDNLKFATSPGNGPYDIILCYDVLDHVEEPQAEVMARLHRLLSPEGVLYLRLHPWTSRHGAHQYEGNGNNLAYWHLAAEPAEVAAAVMVPPYRVIRPLAIYEALVRDAGFKVLERRIDSHEPEPYFADATLDAIIRNTWGQIDADQAHKIMAIQHVDYLLRR